VRVRVVPRGVGAVEGGMAVLALELGVVEGGKAQVLVVFGFSFLGLWGVGGGFVCVGGGEGWGGAVLFDRWLIGKEKIVVCVQAM
jgi:hypothetical protein